MIGNPLTKDIHARIDRATKRRQTLRRVMLTVGGNDFAHQLGRVPSQVAVTLTVHIGATVGVVYSRSKQHVYVGLAGGASVAEADIYLEG